METKTTINGTAATIAIDGKVTVTTSPDLEDAIASLPDEVTDVTFDMSGTDYISSSGLRILVSVAKTTKERGGKMTILDPKDDVYEIFEMTGLSEVLSIER